MALVPRAGSAGLRYEVLDWDKRTPGKKVLEGFGVVIHGVVAPGGTMIAGSSPFEPQTKEHAYYLQCIDLKTGKQKKYLTSHYSTEYSAFSSDGRYVASVVWRSATAPTEIGIVDVAKDREFFLPKSPFEMAFAPTWKPGTDELFVVGVSANLAGIYSIRTGGTAWKTVRAPDANFFSKYLDFHPSKDVIAFSGKFGKASGGFLLDLRDGSVTNILELPVKKLRYSPRGDMLAFDTRIRGRSFGYYLVEKKQLVELAEFGDSVFPSWVHPVKPLSP